MPDVVVPSSTGDLRAVRRRCIARLRTLPLPVPFDLRVFCAALAAERGRLLLLEPFPIGATLRRSPRPSPGPESATTGVWYAGAATDYIFYEHETSPLHQEHIILHELSHLLCGHPPRVEAATGLQATMLPHVRLDLIEGALQRGAYSTAEEREAEMLASLILERAVPSAPGPSPLPDVGDGPAGTLRRLGAVLEAERESSV